MVGVGPVGGQRPWVRAFLLTSESYSILVLTVYRYIGTYPSTVQSLWDMPKLLVILWSGTPAVLCDLEP
eukprot:597243-Amphidinium_carterae.1